MTAKGGVIEDVAGDEAGPEAGQTGQATPAASAAAVTETNSGASKGLGIVALILGALGLLVGVGALAGSRRGKASA